MEAGEDRRSPEFERRFVNEVASELNHALMDDPDSERIVLGGNLKLAHAVKNGLHPTVRERVVAVEPIDFKASNQEIAATVHELAAAYEEAHDLAEVEELIRLANRGGAAVLERQGVETALGRGQVKKLVVPYPIDASDFDELIVDAVLHNVEIEFVYGAATTRLNEFGGIGAELYYSLA